MEIITNTTQFYLRRETAAAIGKFDGIHIGHRRLLDEILSRKKEGLATCVFTFDPPPAVLFGGYAGKKGDTSAQFFLHSREEKRILFERMGVDILIEFPLNWETAAMLPETFVYEILAKQMNVRFLAAGKDLSFGAKGAGNAALLQKLGPKLGFDFMTIDKVCVDGQEVSSTLVRGKVEEGNMEMVEYLLGMPYMIVGRVEKGNQIGRTIGFPTINILPAENKLLPPNGVYFSQVRYNGKETFYGSVVSHGSGAFREGDASHGNGAFREGDASHGNGVFREGDASHESGASHGSGASTKGLYRAISNVGYKPTVSDRRILGVETYLYDFEEEIYGREVEIYLRKFHRPERHFDSLEMLQKQLMEDIAVRGREKM